MWLFVILELIVRENRELDMNSDLEANMSLVNKVAQSLASDQKNNPIDRMGWSEAIDCACTQRTKPELIYNTPDETS